MIASAGVATGNAVDRDVLLLVVAALTATLVSVTLYYYLPLTAMGGKWFIRRTRRRVKRARRFLRVAKVGRALWTIDVFVALSGRFCVMLYAAVFLLVVVPIAITIGSFMLAASIVR